MQEQSINFLNRLTRPFQYLKAPTDFAKIDDLSIPKHLNLRNGVYEQTVKITFLGDLMGLGTKELILDDSVIMILDNSDYIVMNLESVLVKNSDLSFEKQFTHHTAFKKLMAQLEARKVLFGVANNHIYDLGPDGVESTLEIIESTGAKYIGLKNKSSVIVKNGLEICASTLWHRKEDNIVNLLSDVKASKNDVIQFLHWGREFQMEPTQGQKQLVKDLKGEFLSIIGHHSHTPQPINMIDKNLVAYSLGNMASGFNSEKINNGIILTVTYGRVKKWQVIEANWDMITSDISDKQCLLRRDQ